MGFYKALSLTGLLQLPASGIKGKGKKTAHLCSMKRLLSVTQKLELKAVVCSTEVSSVDAILLMAFTRC